VVEIFDMFEDGFANSRRLKSLKRHHWTAFNAIDGTQSLADIPRYQTGGEFSLGGNAGRLNW
jgi:hypothetical protein